MNVALVILSLYTEKKFSSFDDSKFPPKAADSLWKCQN